MASGPNGVLTARERRLVLLVIDGYSNAEIAARLKLRRQTVKNQLAAVYQKVGVRTRVQLAVLAMRGRLV
jgi:DNA-binding CsgD family transcriptional regulator